MAVLILTIIPRVMCDDCPTLQKRTLSLKKVKSPRARVCFRLMQGTLRCWQARTLWLLHILAACPLGQNTQRDWALKIATLKILIPYNAPYICCFLTRAPTVLIESGKGTLSFFVSTLSGACPFLWLDGWVGVSGVCLFPLPVDLHLPGWLL